MTAKLQLYRFIEDAWSDGIHDWCTRASRRSLEGWHCWLVVANRGQARWFRQKSLAAGITTFGVRFLEPHALRREMCGLLGLETVLLDAATLEFLLKVLALEKEDPESLSVARNPSACLRAMEELGLAGRRGEGRMRDFAALLGAGYAWMPGVDVELSKRAGPRPLACCLAGWDAGNWREADLLASVVRCSKSLEAYIPMPRNVNEKLQQEWIAELETRLGVASSECTASGFVSGNETLVERLEGADLRSEDEPRADFPIGQEWSDEMQLVRDDVISWLGSSAGHVRLGIIAPSRSASTVHLVRALTEAGVTVLDETSERQEPPLDLQIQREMVRYHLLNGDVDALLAMVALLSRRANAGAIDPKKAREWLRRRFSQVQTRNARLLVQAEAGPGSLSDDLRGLVKRLGRWEEKTSWSAAREQWEECLHAFGVTAEPLEPLWSQTASLLDHRKFPSHAFLEYLEALLSGSSLQPASEPAFAKVVVTTFSKAHHQSWDRLIFLDSNEGVWPARQDENPFLDDAQRTALNRRRAAGEGRLLLSFEQAGIEQARFLDLMENCTGGIAFAATARDAADASREAGLNAWATRVLAETGSPIAWKKLVAVSAPAPPLLVSEEADPLKCVHESRRNPCMPFDRYHFNFHESSYEASWWNATALDTALGCPATFALREILGAEAAREEEFKRTESLAVGILAHGWLARALGGTDELAIFEFPKDLEGRIGRLLGEKEVGLAQLFRTENLPVPLWWRSVLHKAAWAARSSAPSLARSSGHSWFAMEKELRAGLVTDSGPLKVKGRIDLLIADRKELDGAILKVIDFKTGKKKKPTVAKLRNAGGFQFAAYYFLAKAHGASSVQTSQINPERGEEEVFGTADEAILRAELGRLAVLQRDLKFGQGAARGEHQEGEDLPMATTPIDPRVLETKAGLPLLAK